MRDQSTATTSVYKEERGRTRLSGRQANDKRVASSEVKEAPVAPRQSTGTQSSGEEVQQFLPQADSSCSTGPFPAFYSYTPAQPQHHEGPQPEWVRHAPQLASGAYALQYSGQPAQGQDVPVQQARLSPGDQPLYGVPNYVMARAAPLQPMETSSASGGSHPRPAGAAELTTMMAFPGPAAPMPAPGGWLYMPHAHLPSSFPPPQAYGWPGQHPVYAFVPGPAVQMPQPPSPSIATPLQQQALHLPQEAEESSKSTADASSTFESESLGQSTTGEVGTSLGTASGQQHKMQHSARIPPKQGENEAKESAAVPVAESRGKYPAKFTQRRFVESHTREKPTYRWRPPPPPVDQSHPKAFQRPASTVPKVGDLQHPAVEKLFGALRKQFPGLKDSALSMVASELVLRELTPPHQAKADSREVSDASVWHTAEALAEGQDWTLSVVREVIAQAKAAFLAGKKFESYGGQAIERSSGGPPCALPMVKPDEAEATIQSLIIHPEMAKLAKKQATAAVVSRPVARRGRSIRLPQEAHALLQGRALHELHKAKIQDLKELLSESKDVSVSSEIDFGVVQTTPAANRSAYDQSGRESLLDVVSMMTRTEEGWELDRTRRQDDTAERGSRMRLRTIKLTAGSKAVTLIDVRAYPELPSTFALVDDAGVCREAEAVLETHSAAVKLSPGEEYTATLLLDTSDGPHRKSESGLMQQLVLFTLLVPNLRATEPDDKSSNEHSPSTSVVGCRVSVALTKQHGELHSLLNFEAKPFVAERLRSLFDIPPARYFADPPPIEAMFKARGLISSVCPWQPEANAVLKGPPPAFRSLGASMKLRNASPAPRQYLGPAYHKSKPSFLSTQICKYTRLLQLEEAAMEDQIRRHDMFNVRYCFAVFEPGPRPQYRLHSTVPGLGTDYHAPPLSSLPKKTYRGPQLSELFKEENMTGCCSRRVLLTLDVPGLPEDRPSLIFGDTVYLRFSAADHAEFAGSVIATEATRCMVAMPKQFYSCLQSTTQQRDNAQAHTLLSIGLEAVRKADFSLVHVRFSFDRTRMQRMHAALAVASIASTFQMLPPETSAGASCNPVEAGLPSREEFLAATTGKKWGLQRVDAPTGSTCTGLAARKAASSIEEVANQRLNAEQRWAVASFIAAGATCPYTLFGPPGTGKTVTLTECCLQILKGDPEARLLVCAPQGYSADLLASGLGRAGVSASEMLRLADPRHPPVQMKEDVLNKFSTYSEQLRAFTLPEPGVIAAKRVIVTTCITAGVLRCGAYKRYHEVCRAGQNVGSTERCGLEFTHVLIDEAGQAMLPEALVPIALMQPKAGKVLLCGDPKQLGPVVRSIHAASGGDGQGLAVSLLEHFIAYNSACAPGRRQRGLAPATGTLVQNYRSHSSLLAIPNALFYNQTLVAAADQSALLPPPWSELQEPTDMPSVKERRLAGEGVQEAVSNMKQMHLTDADAASIDSLEEETERSSGIIAEGEEFTGPSTLFFGVRGKQMREGEAPSYFNPIEATALVDLLEGLLKQHRTESGTPMVTQDDIGVIATYRKQVQKIRLLLRGRGLGGIRVGTVDDLQGQEERIIFISTVLSKPETLPPVMGGKDADIHLGFWRNPKRFNVAVTRAKALLVVLGHPMVLVEDPSWCQLLRFCAARGAYRGYGAQALSHHLHVDSSNVSHIPGLTDGQTDDHPGESWDQDIAAAVSQIAEMALLGSGHAAQIFPESFEDACAAYGDEVQWRVAL